MSEYRPHPDVLALGAEIEVVEGAVGLSGDAFARWAEAFQTVPSGLRERVAAELLAMALRFERLTASAQPVIFQLALLIAVLLRDPGAADALVRGAGLAGQNLAKLLGNDGTPRAPSVEAKARASASSLLAAKAISLARERSK